MPKWEQPNQFLLKYSTDSSHHITALTILVLGPTLTYVSDDKGIRGAGF